MKFSKPFEGEVLPVDAPQYVMMKLEGIDNPIEIPITLLTEAALVEMAERWRQQLFNFAGKNDPDTLGDCPF